MTDKVTVTGSSFTLCIRYSDGHERKETFESLHLFKRRVEYYQQTGLIPQDEFKDFCSI